jgi:hypothetical protein
MKSNKIRKELMDSLSNAKANYYRSKGLYENEKNLGKYSVEHIYLTHVKEDKKLIKALITVINYYSLPGEFLKTSEYL